MAEISTNCFICNQVPATQTEPKLISGGDGPRRRAKSLFILLHRVLELPDFDLAEDQSEIANQISFCKSCLHDLEVTKNMLDAFEKVKKMAERHKKEIQSKFLESKGQGSHSKSNKNVEIGGVTELRSQVVAELKSRSGSTSLTISSKTSGVIKNLTSTTKPNLPKDSGGESRNVDSFEQNGEGGVQNIAKELISSDDLCSQQRPSTPLPVPTTKASSSGKKEVSHDPSNSNQQIRPGEKKLPTSPCSAQNIPEAAPLKTPIKSNEKKHKCQLCPSMFKQKCDLTQHLRIHTGDKPFPCKLCPKTFSSKSNLKQHQLVHNGKKELRCRFCSKTFGRSYELQVHERVHTGEKPFLCKICSKTFSQSSDLVRHMRTHTREKPYPCNMCTKTFSQPGTLVNHTRTHTREKPYLCKMCFKTFAASNDLGRHMRTHTREKPYKCTVCSKEFAHLRTLKDHKKTQHLLVG